MKLLYLCNNDGSDVRINKEVKTLARYFQIDYVGMKQDEEHCFVAPWVKRMYFVKSKRRSIKGILRYFLLVTRLIVATNYQRIHIVNEPLLLVCFPLLLFSRSKVALDLFDSIFLRINATEEKYMFAKSLLYANVQYILVTDETRKCLLPAKFHSKTKVLPNYPPFFNSVHKREVSDSLTILYYGWFGAYRGTDFLLDLLQLEGRDLQIIMVGWFGDEKSKQLLRYKQVRYLGIMTQQQSIQLAAQHADYILCMYKPINENNIYASPNKLYEAIQAQVPVIMNAEVKVASLVKELGIGVVLPCYQPQGLEQWLDKLLSMKGSFSFSAKLKQNYSWEQVEHVLLEAHNYENSTLYKSISKNK